MGSSSTAAAASAGALGFNSWHFLLLASVAVLVYRFAPAGRLKAAWLLLCSLYMIVMLAPRWPALAVLAVALAITYAVARWRADKAGTESDATVLFIVAAFWLPLLYIRNPYGLLDPITTQLVHVVGLSYLTFRAVSYVADARLVEDRSVLAFLNYMLFFPTLVAGPIERAPAFIPQIGKDAPLPAEDALSALHRIANGFIKKFVLADNLAPFGLFALPHDAAAPMLWLGVLLQLLIIYLDFSGYTDIAIGIGRLMGFKLTENFNAPLLSRNPAQFWSRWHVSLTSFVQDYVFTPMSKLVVRHVPRHVQLPAMLGVLALTMMIIALWHGMTLGFVAFGAVHGLALIGLQLKARDKRLRNLTASSLGASEAGRTLLAWLSIAATYLFVSLTLLFWWTSPWSAVLVLVRMLGVD